MIDETRMASPYNSLDREQTPRLDERA